MYIYHIKKYQLLLVLGYYFTIMSKSVKTKKCDGCKKYFTLDKFETDKVNGTTYTRNQCITCRKIYKNKRYGKFDGFIRGILGNTKNHAKRRSESGRKEAGTFTLTYDQIVDLYNRQNGLCYYSNIKLSMATRTNWKCSIDRIDDTKGYTIDNVVLACLEFNNKLKWSPEKLREMIMNIIAKHDREELCKEIDEKLLEMANKRKKEKRVYKTIDGVKHWQCAVCKKFLTMDKVRKCIKRCVPCQRVIKKKNLATLRGHVKALISHARCHTRDRKNTTSRKNNATLKDEFNLSFEDAITILKKQAGLCYYSNIKMNYGSILDKNWVASLERIDATKGYTKDNVCFVCYEFNTTDNRANFRYDHGRTGSGNWSQNKFLYFLEHYLNRKTKIVTL